MLHHIYPRDNYEGLWKRGESLITRTVYGEISLQSDTPFKYFLYGETLNISINSSFEITYSGDHDFSIVNVLDNDCPWAVSNEETKIRFTKPDINISTRLPIKIQIVDKHSNVVREISYVLLLESRIAKSCVMIWENVDSEFRRVRPLIINNKVWADVKSDFYVLIETASGIRWKVTSKMNMFKYKITSQYIEEESLHVLTFKSITDMFSDNVLTIKSDEKVITKVVLG